MQSEDVEGIQGKMSSVSANVERPQGLHIRAQPLCQALRKWHIPKSMFSEPSVKSRASVLQPPVTCPTDNHLD